MSLTATNAGLLSGMGMFSVALSGTDALYMAHPTSSLALSPVFENAVHDQLISDDGDLIDHSMRPKMTLDRIINPGDTQREWAMNARRFIEAPLRSVVDTELPEALEYLRDYEAQREPDAAMIAGARQYLESVFNVALLKECIRLDPMFRTSYANKLWDLPQYADIGELIGLEAEIERRDAGGAADLIKRLDELRKAIEGKIREGLFRGLTRDDRDIEIEFGWRDGLLEGAKVRKPTQAVLRRLFESEYAPFLNWLSLRGIFKERFGEVISMPEFSRLRKLYLRYNTIGPYEMRDFCQAARHLTNLRVLVLQVNYMGPYGMRDFYQVTQHLTNLRELNLAYNGIRAEGMRHLPQIVRHLPNLHELNLVQNGIGAEGMRHLPQIVRHLPNLRELNLADNGIGSEGMRHFASADEHLTNLHMLDLGVNGIGAEGMSFFAQVAHSFTNLRELYLWGNSIGDECMRMFAGVVRRHLTNLSKLDLRNNGLNADGMNAVAKSLQDHPNLRKLLI